MALLVSDVLIQSVKGKWDLERTMSSMAESFIKDLNDKTYGWAAPFRAPGNACLKGVRQLKAIPVSQRAQGWWNVHASEAGGCGSVMRAFPFGLIFSHDPQKAKLWAVEHSKITHGHPRALSSCAAMAVGIAYALQAEDPLSTDIIIAKMIEAAEEYHPDTAQKMRTAVKYAKEAQPLIIHACTYDPFSPHKNCRHNFDITMTLKDPVYRAFHEKVFTEFEGWAADDSIAATIYVFALFPHDLTSALYLAVHTPGDSDSIAAMSGALIGAFTRSPLPISTKLESTPWLEDVAQQINNFAQSGGTKNPPLTPLVNKKKWQTLAQVTVFGISLFLAYTLYKRYAGQ